MKHNNGGIKSTTLTLMPWYDWIVFVVWLHKRPCFFSNRDHCHIFSQSQMPDMAQPKFELVQNLSSGFLQWSCTRRSWVGICNFSLHIESGFICQQKKLFWISSFRNLVKDWVLLAFTGPKRVLEIILAWWVLAHKTEYSFQYIFWIINHLVMKLDQYRDIPMGNIFGNYFS